MKIYSTGVLGEGAFGTLDLFVQPQGQPLAHLGNIPPGLVPRGEEVHTNLKKAGEYGGVRLKRVRAGVAFKGDAEALAAQLKTVLVELRVGKNVEQALTFEEAFLEADVDLTLKPTDPFKVSLQVFDELRLGWKPQGQKREPGELLSGPLVFVRVEFDAEEVSP